jgi:hypothetical protein
MVAKAFIWKSVAAEHDFIETEISKLKIRI